MTPIFSVTLAFMLSIGSGFNQNVNISQKPYLELKFENRSLHQVQILKNDKQKTVLRVFIKNSRLMVEFIPVDPLINKKEALINPQLWYLYSYCQNNPITYLDPDGRIFKESSKEEIYQKVPVIKQIDDAIEKFNQARQFCMDITLSIAMGFFMGPMDFAAPKSSGTPRSSTKPTSGQIRAYERQLREYGRDTLLKSRNTLSRRLGKHLSDLKNYKKVGGYTSKTLKEIRNFKQQIKAIDEVLRRNR